MAKGDRSRFPDCRVQHADRLHIDLTVTTKDSFGDAVWHIEFRLPYQPKDRGQGRGNSGVYVMGSYESQMLERPGVPGLPSGAFIG
jgi:hypothetical protein